MEPLVNFFTSINANTLIIVIGAVFLAYNQYRQGANKVSSEVIDAYREQVSQYKDQVTGFANKLSEANEQRGKQDGVIIEKEKQIKAYEAILQNRNPELEKILVQISEFMSKMYTMMQENKGEMKTQTTLLQKVSTDNPSQ